MSTSADAASDLIRIIREQHGFDDDQSIPSPAVRELRGKLERALERLSSDLYNKKTHFLLEFIQNADDNTYADDVTPSLNLRIEDSLVVFECNERGFLADNVKAICDIGQSTKTRENATRGFIGEKGIGFKSVFTVADEVHISSGPYSFYFDRTAQLGMITPVWGSDYPPRPGWTTFHLRLAPTENGTYLSAQLNGLRPTLLLFLRQLRVLNVTVPGATRRGASALQMRRKDGPGDDLVSLERIDNGESKVEKYVLVRHLAQTPAQEPGREGVEQSEIMLAFPVTETGEPVIERQEVHAFLPLRYYGFNFIVQADFITSASREDVLADREWNCALLRSIVDTFLLAVNRFADHPTLRNLWFRYLPEAISDGFFCYVEHKLMTELQHRPILRSSNGTYVRASQLFVLPMSFRDDFDAPLIPEAHLPRGMYYLSSDYDAYGRDGLILRRLGVREMTDDDFLVGLTKMDQANLFGSQSAAWHESVATCLLRLPHTFGRSTRPEVMLLRIIPLHKGSWAVASLASRFMFPPTGVNIPDDLDLQSVAPGISMFSARYHLFDRLGVTLPNPVAIANKILLAGGPRTVLNRLDHARFFFEHRKVSKMPSATRLRLVDEREEAAQADELYLDIPGEDGALALRDALSPLTARFLHPDYLSAYPEETPDNETGEDEVRANPRSEWIAWLRDDVGVNVVPRVLNGYIAPEFINNAPKLVGYELVASLRAWWPRLFKRLRAEGARALGGIPIAGRRLDKLYLRRGALARADQALELPFVPVDDPEDRGWDFLEQLGVTTRLNAQFFLNKLVHMQGEGEKDSEAAAEIYRQLDARFDEDEESIRDAFTKDPIILAVNGQSERVWLRKMDVYWDGPPSMTTRAVISHSYPNLSNFFFRKLGITSAPPYALVEELRAVARQHQHGLVPPGVREHITNILADISKIMQTMPKMPPSFADLAQIAVFPASVPSVGVALCTVDEFYVPDKSGKYADVFRERVPLFALSESDITRIRPLLESSILRDKMRYLEEHVTKRSTPLGKRVIDLKATDLYSSRVEYIARLVYNANKMSLPQQAKVFLPKLHKITVIGVDSITTTLSLGRWNEPTPEDVSFEETDDKFTAFFSRTKGISGKSIDLHICKELSRLLGVEMKTLFTCVVHNAEVIRDLFKFDGVEEIPDDDDVDGSWLQAMLHPNEPVVPAPAAVVVQDERSLCLVSPSPPLPPSPTLTTLSVQDAGQFPPLGTHGPKTPRRRTDTQSSQYPASPANGNGRRRHRSVQSSVGVSEHSQFFQGSRSPFDANGLAQGQPVASLGLSGAVMGAARDVARLAAQAQAHANGNQMVPGTQGNPVWPPFGNFNVPPTATGDTDLVGVMGEHYVYKMLIRMLDDFGPNNWTSELRHFIPGFAPFHGTAFADFTYDDTRGQLTREWFGPEKAAAWHSRWPRYHIEVKATSREENEPFHMSRVQMITASRFSERADVGTDMYVVVRVSRIGMPEPSYMVYADPHRALFYGHLQYASPDIYLQRNTEFQV
ncbi:hypothetical protein EDB92DRAFT_1805391 [Lactarius akahatsu]|uniref:Protein NO VEIN C-terminal domain-containing protein n=1 Tax=Lactarius akahatsu TaxID=416441 RepID=A0AAD4LC79_9AGAM|nr:hypothetical protein EDB92DRAFT_1805391 [Lactarius akahatsu]